MKTPDFKNFKSGFTTRSFRVGGYSIVSTAIVLAIVIAVNLLVNAIPTRYTQIDTSSDQLYSISEQTEMILGKLDREITVNWIVQAEYEDTMLELFLDRYQSLSSNLKVEKIDPDVYPTFTNQYTTAKVANNSLIVTCGDRYRYVSYTEIFEQVYASDYQYTGNYEVRFHGESLLTSAVTYLTNDDLPKIYSLSGHGEYLLSDDYAKALTNQNMEYEDISLIMENAVPEDADCVLLNAPTADISAEEKEMLLTYLNNGGNLFIITDPAEDGKGYPNLEALMLEYGIQANPGVVLDPTSRYYAYGTPFYLLPDMVSHPVTEPLLNNGYYILLPVAGGLTEAEDIRSTLTVEPLLTTSDDAFSKISGYNMSTYEKEEGDIDGPFALAIAVTDQVSEDVQSKLVCVSTGALVDDATNQQVSGGNQDLFLNALAWMCGQEDSISIHAKTFSTQYLTMDSSTSNLLTILMVGIIPLVSLSIGIYIMIRRKRR